MYGRKRRRKEEMRRTRTRNRGGRGQGNYYRQDQGTVTKEISEIWIAWNQRYHYEVIISYSSIWKGRERGAGSGKL